MCKVVYMLLYHDPCLDFRVLGPTQLAWQVLVAPKIKQRPKCETMFLTLARWNSFYELLSRLGIGMNKQIILIINLTKCTCNRHGLFGRKILNGIAAPPF